MFGIKVHPAQLFQHTGRNLDRITSLLSRFDRIILMTRRDKLGQAISRTIAEATNIWFNDGSEVQLSAAEQRRLVPAIARNLAMCIEDESAVLEIRRRVVRPLIRVAYEDIEETPHEVFQEITAFLSGGIADTLDEGNEFPTPEKPAGITAGELRRLFLASIQGHRL